MTVESLEFKVDSFYGFCWSPSSANLHHQQISTEMNHLTVLRFAGVGWGGSHQSAFGESVRQINPPQCP